MVLSPAGHYLMACGVDSQPFLNFFFFKASMLKRLLDYWRVLPCGSETKRKMFRNVVSRPMWCQWPCQIMIKTKKKVDLGSDLCVLWHHYGDGSLLWKTTSGWKVCQRQTILRKCCRWTSECFKVSMHCPKSYMCTANVHFSDEIYTAAFPFI